MTITFKDFLVEFIHNPSLIIITILISGVIFVNGLADAPNAIATCVSTRCLSPQKAIFMSAIGNFLGIFIMTYISSNVAETIFKIANFGDNSSLALKSLCAALFSIVIWSGITGHFGIPTSQSHALIAGMSGSAIAICNGFYALNLGELIKVIIGLIISIVIGFFLGFFNAKIIEKICKNIERPKTIKFFRKSQIISSGIMAFMNGAQDGQKFMGVFLLGIFFSKQNMELTGFQIPIWMMFMCFILMALGTAVGGYKIIKTVGMKMVKLEVYQGAIVDISCSICLFISSILGIPISSSNTKTTTIMGVGASRNLHNVNWNVVKNMILAWVLTFPGCGFLSYIITNIFI